MISKNTRAQLGATLTWFVAFLIIFFIMALFISGTILISTRKKGSFSGESLSLGTQTSSLKSQRYAISLLNSKINGNELEDYVKNNLEKEEYLELSDYAIEYFKDSDLLWRIYIWNPNSKEIYKVLTPWSRTIFDCKRGESFMEIEFLDSNEKRIVVQVEVCDGEIDKDTKSFKWAGR